MNHEEMGLLTSKESLTCKMDTILAELRCIGEMLHITLPETTIEGLKARAGEAICWIEAIHNEVIKL